MCRNRREEYRELCLCYSARLRIPSAMHRVAVDITEAYYSEKASATLGSQTIPSQSPLTCRMIIDFGVIIFGSHVYSAFFKFMEIFPSIWQLLISSVVAAVVYHWGHILHASSHTQITPLVRLLPVNLTRDGTQHVSVHVPVLLKTIGTKVLNHITILPESRQFERTRE